MAWNVPSLRKNGKNKFVKERACYKMAWTCRLAIYPTQREMETGGKKVNRKAKQMRQPPSNIAEDLWREVGVLPTLLPAHLWTTQFTTWIPPSPPRKVYNLRRESLQWRNQLSSLLTFNRDVEMYFFLRIKKKEKKKLIDACLRIIQRVHTDARPICFQSTFEFPFYPFIQHRPVFLDWKRPSLEISLTKGG